MYKKMILALVVAAICFHPLLASAAANKTQNKAAGSKITARYGMKGNDVKKVQEQLIKAGFLQGKADGIFGKATYMAVKEFQAAVKLDADGIVGSKTIAALKKYKPPRNKVQPNREKKAASPAVKVTKPAPEKPQQQDKPRVEVEDIPENWQPIRLESTAYTRYDEGCTDLTYRGNYVRRGLVAVDPAIIPLGTRLYVPGYGYAVADDIGGAIRGHKIDLAMETQEEAFTYGRRHITAYIIG